MTALATIKEASTNGAVGIRDRIEQLSDPIARALPVGVNVDTFIAAAVTEIRYNPDLRKIAQNPKTVESIFGAIFTCAQLGLTPGKTLGHAWLVPRYDKNVKAKMCVFQLGYKGVLKLARRTGSIGSVIAGHAFDGEIAEESEGIVDGKFVTNFMVRPLRPRPMLPMTPPESADQVDPSVVYYCLIEVLNGTSVHATMSAPEAFRHFERIHPMAKGKGGEWYRPRSAWSTDYPTMAAISAFRGAVRFLDKNTELDRALANENTVRLDLSPDAIDNATFDEPIDVQAQEHAAAEPLAFDYAAAHGLDVAQCNTEQAALSVVAHSLSVTIDEAEAHVREWAAQ